VKKKAYAYSSADLSIRHQKVAFCFPFSSSSSIFFNGGLRESLKLSYEHPMLLRPDSFSIESQKLSKNRSIIAWKTKGRKKPKPPEERRCHHGLAVASTTVVPTGRGTVVLLGTMRFACLPWSAGCLSLGLFASSLA